MKCNNKKVDLKKGSVPLKAMLELEFAMKYAVYVPCAHISRQSDLRWWYVRMESRKKDLVYSESSRTSALSPRLVYEFRNPLRIR